MTSSEIPSDKKRSFDTFKARVESTELLSPRVRNIRFQFLNGGLMPFKAGQFVQMFIPLPDGAVRRTSYSIASSPSRRDGFDLCVTHVEGGKSSTFLHGLKVDDEIQVMGPLGKFILPDPLPRDPVFVSTGSGIAPFRSMIHDLAERKTERTIRLIFGNRFEEDILYRREWESLAASFPRLKILFTLSRAGESWAGPKGYVQDNVESFVPEPAGKDFYICGLVKMIEGVSDRLKALGVSPDHIHYERYD